MKPKSPTRLVRKAFFAASAAEFFSYQWPMRRKELSPTSSQKMKVMMKFEARTMPVIENMKEGRGR